MGSCINTLVSSTNSLAGPVGTFFLGLASGLLCCGALSVVVLILLGSCLSKYNTTWGASLDTGSGEGGAVRFGF